MTYNDSWGKVLNKHLHNRCKICPDGVGMQADIVCADAWETDEKGYPIFQEKSGYSLLISRTKHGDDLRKKAFNDKVIHIEKYEVEKLPKIQPYQYKRKIFILSRLIAMKVLGLKIPKYINLKLLNAAKKDISSSQIISFFGMVARIISKIRK